MKAFLNLFEQRVRGIRIIELVGIGLALGMIFWVLLSKARESEDVKRMNDLDAQITEEQQSVDALKIKVAGLERPARLEGLAVQYLGMKPVEAAHEADLDSIAEISRTTSLAVPNAAPAAAVPAAPPAAPAATESDELISTANPPAPEKKP